MTSRPVAALATAGALAAVLSLAGCSRIPDCTSPAAQALATDIMAKTTENRLLKTLIYADPRALIADRMRQYTPDVLAHYKELCERPGLVFEGDFTKGESESPARCKVRIDQQFRANRTRTVNILAAEFPTVAQELKDVDALLASYSSKLEAAQTSATYALSEVRSTGTIERYGISSCAAVLTLAFGEFGSTSLPIEYDMQTGEDGKLRGAVYGAVDAPR